MNAITDQGIFEKPPRRDSVAVQVGNVTVGGGAPIVVQSMTNTDTADIDSTVQQVAALAAAGSEIVRITVDRDEAAKAVPYIRDRLMLMGIDVPIVGDFHYIGHTLLNDNPACAEALAKYRINPGNVGFREKRDVQFSTMIEIANKYVKPVRIGVNWGSLDQELLTRMMDENTAAGNPKDAAQVMRDAMVVSGLASAERAMELGMPKDRIIISAKVSAVQDPYCRLPRFGGTVRLRAASRPDRGGHGQQGHRCFRRRHGHPFAARDRRHHPYLADAGTRR